MIKKTSIFLFTFTLIFLPMVISYAQPAIDPEYGTLGNPFSGGNDLYAFVKVVITNIVIPVGAVVVVFFLIYAGFLFVTAGGSEEKLKRSKTNFLWVVVGTAVLLGSWAIATVIENTINQIKRNP